MSLVQCSHKNSSPAGRICAHLLAILSRDDDPETEHAKWFDGQSEDYALVCSRGCDAVSQGKSMMVSVCGDCLEYIEDNGTCTAVIGRPLVPERATDMSFTHITVSLNGLTVEAIADIQPINSKVGNVWLAVTKEGNLVSVDLDEKAISHITRIPENVWHEMDEVDEVVVYSRDEPKGRTEKRTTHIGVKLHIHISNDGHLAAVVNDRGKYGIVVDVKSGQTLMQLDRGRTYYHVTNFPIAFFSLDGRTLLVHGTAWNRLDISDPLTGKLLTQRATPVREKTGDEPAHYLDYFHAGLRISPNTDWIVDWGWVWHPVGAIRAWDLRRWAKDNVWESEDGMSLSRFCWRSYDWDQPTFWANNRTLCVWGYGDDADCLIPGICFYDVQTGEQLRWFKGPEGKLEFDQHLYSFNEEVGISIWDIETGERLLHQPEFCPNGYHYGTKQFLSFLPNGDFQLSRLVNG